jgi:hypothetical protein
MAKTCELCSLPASGAHNKFMEIYPIQDTVGDWWRSYKFVSGPHYRCVGHPLRPGSNIISLNQNTNGLLTIFC